MRYPAVNRNRTAVWLVWFTMALGGAMATAAPGGSGAVNRTRGVWADGVLAHGGDDGAGGGAEREHDKADRRAHFVRWVGHFHPAMTVFPIAMLLGAALAELLLVLRRAAWLDGASRWCVIVGESYLFEVV